MDKKWASRVIDANKSIGKFSVRARNLLLKRYFLENSKTF